MTIDEALDVLGGLGYDPVRNDLDVVTATLAALATAATERGRAEERKHLHDWAMERGAMAMRDDDPVSAGVWEAVADLLRLNDDGDLAECCALEDLLAAHGREAAAAERERLRREVEPVHEAIQCAMCLVLPTPPIAGDRSMAYETLENADSMLAAALRGKEGTDAN